MASVLVVAALTAFFARLGSNAADRISPPSSDRSQTLPSQTQPSPPSRRRPALISSSSREMKWECTYGTFLPSLVAQRVLERDPPRDWTGEIQRQPGAVFVSREIVEVSIQGESARVVTLTGIRFHVVRRPPPNGEVFIAPCGGPFTGRAMEVNLDARPPRIELSSQDVDGMLGSVDSAGRPTRPIRFPWIVSLTDPLLLYLFAGTASCYCEWTAQIPWVSGGRRGVISIDDDGRPYKVVAGAGLPVHMPDGHGWSTEISAAAP